MLEFVKEYGVTNLDFEYIMHNLKIDTIEIMSLSEAIIRNNLEYYNSLGITSDIAKIIMARPDLIIIDNDYLKELINTVDLDLFRNVVSKSIEDLILMGI